MSPLSVRVLLVCAVVLAVDAPLLHGENELPDAGSRFIARDSLDPGHEASADARQCLNGLCWEPEKFRVRLETAREDRGDWLVRFPSPVNSGDERNDLVAMEWYQAWGEQFRPKSAPAIVVVHESGSRMTAGRIFARGLRLQGFHTFLLHLPSYGERQTGRGRPEGVDLVTSMKQGVADVRRARDAVAALPFVDDSQISLQGTSLGGIVATIAAALDDGYRNVFLMLAGADLYDLLRHGKRDAAKVRRRLEASGLADQELEKLVRTLEPLRIVHRLDPQHVWLYSGRFDTVVPLKNARALARSAGLPESHHILMAANHYTGVLYLPFVLTHIARHARAE